MNLAELHARIVDLLLSVPDQEQVNVRVHVGGGEYSRIEGIDLYMREPENWEHAEESWDLQLNGRPKQGTDFDQSGDLTVVIDAG